jgi:mono/diheme cytochrome c family protein
MKKLLIILVLGALLIALLWVSLDHRRSEPFRGPIEARTASVDRGEQKFAQYCFKCHPSGEAGLGPSLNWNPAPRFVLAFQIRQGLGTMPAFAREHLTDEDMSDIITYLKALKRNK